MKNFLLIVAALIPICFTAVNCTAQKEKQQQPASDPAAVMKSHVVVDSCALAEKENFIDEMEDVVQFELLNKEPFSWYNNLIFKDEKLISYLLEKHAKRLPYVNLPIGDTTLVNVVIQDTVPKDVFLRFAGFRLLNNWEDFKEIYGERYHYSTKEEAVCARVKNHILNYCGQVKLSKNFDSFLLMITPEYELKDDRLYAHRELFLVNLSNEKITSVSELYSYFLLEGHSDCAHTIVKRNNDFCISFEELSSDVIVAKEVADEDPRMFRIVNFKFDKKGRVVILTDKKQAR